MEIKKLKVGRNDLCPCGSGKKYKKCHLNPTEPITNNSLLTGRPIISREKDGFRLVAVGSRLYPRFPIDKTFHEFLITFMKDILGIEWGMKEQEKPKEERHIILQWLSDMTELIETAPIRMEIPEKDIKSTEPSGNVLSLLSLAYDIYSIYHSSKLPDELIARLKVMDQFQGAKYEIAVAGIFSRAGFKIEWLPKSTEKVCEFIAKHRVTGEQVIVEAKSRHRDGVLNRPGTMKELSQMKTEVTQLFNKALGKSTQVFPYIIFIDINLPLTPGDNTLEKRWVDDIKKMLDRYPLNSTQSPSKYNGLFITNFSWHYQAKETDLKMHESITILPFYPEIVIKNSSYIDILREAINQYGQIPGLFPEDRKEVQKLP